MGNFPALAGRCFDDEFRFDTGAVTRTGSPYPRRRTFWVDALLHLQPDGRDRHSNASGAASLEKGGQHCSHRQSLQLRTAGWRELYELGRLLGAFQMIRPGPLSAFLLPIICLSACGMSGNDDPKAGWKYSYDCGLAAQNSGDLQKAESCFRDSLAALPPEERSQKSAESSLALAGVLLEKRDCQSALTSAEKAMTFFESQWSPSKSSSSLDDSGTKYLTSMLIAARSLNCQHRYSESLPLLKRISTLQEKVIVPLKFNHELTQALGESLIGLGRREEARKLKQEIKSTESSLASANSSDIITLTAQQALKEGRSALQGGNFSLAEKLLNHALATAQKEDPQSITTAEALLRLGDLQSSRGNYAKAQGLLEKALKMARRRLPKDDRDLKDYMKRLASLYANQSEWKKAAALDEEALTIICKSEEAQDKHMHRSRDVMDALIDIYRKDGQLDKAEKMARRKLALEIDAYGKDSRKVGVTACILAEILELRRNSREAEKYYQLSIDVLKRNSKTDPRDMRKILHAYANFLLKKGDREGAMRLRADEKALNSELVDVLDGKQH